MDNPISHGAKLAKPPLVRIFLVQGLVLLAVSMALLLVEVTTASSALLGGLIFIAPQAYFARWAFRFSGARSADLVARGFYIGQAGKFILTVVMFAGVFAFIKPLNSTMIFVAYLAMVALNCLLLARIR